MSASSASLTALVVESDYLIASVIEMPLAAAGYDVLIATTPQEAFAYMAGRQVHIALIDFRLQHAYPDGLVARLKARNVPYIFCTAASPDEVLEVFPVALVVPKPFRDEDLLSAVSAATSASSDSD